MKKIILYGIGLILLSIIIIFMLSKGILEISFFQTNEIMISIILGEYMNNIQSDVIYYLRLPRMILAVLIGIGLAIVGCVMQAILRNPLADPYLLGISSGAGLGAVLAIILGFTNIFGLNCIGIFAFSGALFISILVVFIIYHFKYFRNINIILLGMALNSICSAIISLLIILYANTENIQNITFWLMGSLNNANWNNIGVLALVILSSITYFIKNTRALNLILLGDDTAKTLGYNIMNKKLLFIVLCAIITGLIVYNSGIICFVGLVIPHMARLCTGNNYNNVLPTSIFLGAIFMVVVDFFSRGAFIGIEIPIGVIVSIVGGPLFIYLLLKKNYKDRQK